MGASGVELWIMTDSNGAVRRAGRHATATQEALVAHVQRQFPAIRVAGARTAVVTNDAGQTVRVVFVELAMGSPAPP
jgi:hypothetical protein